MSFLHMFARVARPECGASSTEYALIVVLVAVGAGVAAAVFGEVLLDFLNEITGAVGEA